MKKLFKVGSTAILAAILAFSSTGCSIKQAKIDERTKAASESSLLYDNDGAPIDFVTTYRNTYINYEGIRTSTVIVSRDSYFRTYYFSHIETLQEPGQEAKIISSIRQRLYIDSGLVKLETSGVRDDNIVNASTVTLNYSETIQAFSNNDEHFDINYYEYSVNQYDLYKSAPLGGCSSDGDKSLLPYIPNRDYYLDTSSCKASKKLFGKDHTYNMEYRVSVSEIDRLEVKLGGNNKLVRAYRLAPQGLENGVEIMEITEFMVA